MTAPDLALHLAARVPVLARCESAGVCFADVEGAVKAIEDLVNRPVPPLFLGPCPVILTDNYGEKLCGADLEVGRDEPLVQCRSCKTTLEVKQILDRQLEAADDMSFTLSELYRTILPAVSEYIPLRTLQHWVARGMLVPTGWDGDEPRYLLAEVRALRDAKPQKKTTGSAAHKRPA